METLPLSHSQYQFMLYAWIALAIIIFFTLLRITAPYGRHTTTGWGPQISNRMGWILMELPVMLVLGMFILTSLQNQTTITWMIIGLFFLHYIHRTFVFPFRIHTKGKTMPLLIVVSAIVFNVMNGFSLGYYFKHFAHYPPDWFGDPRFILGTVLFLTGMWINWRSDNHLIHLRKPGETHYVIPRSSMFKWVSCPNLSGELLEWAGFALLCWNLPALTFFIWTAANLIPRAMSHHQWYKNRFEDYPAERKAIIPFVV